MKQKVILEMSKTIKIETSSTFNFNADVVDQCHCSQFETEICESDLTVWNEGNKIFMSISLMIEIVDVDNVANHAVVTLEQNKVRLESLERDQMYTGRNTDIVLERISSNDEEVIGRFKDFISSTMFEFLVHVYIV